MDFGYTNDPTAVVCLYKWNNNKDEPKWRYNIMMLNGIVSISGVLMVILLTKCKLSTYFFEPTHIF